MNRIISTVFVLAVSLAMICMVLSCASYRKSSGHWEHREPVIDISGIQTIAVLPFDVHSGPNGAGEMIADDIEGWLVEHSPFQVITRTRLTELLREQGLSAQGIIDPKTAIEINRISGVDVLLVGLIDYWGEGTFDVNKGILFGGIQRYMYARIVWKYKLIDAKSGLILWIDKSDSRSDGYQDSKYDEYAQARSNALKALWKIVPHQTWIK